MPRTSNMRLQRVTVLTLTGLALVASGVPGQATHALDVHWAHGQTPKIVYLLDRSEGRIPVNQAAGNWNRTSNFQFIVVADCPVAADCVEVRERPLPRNYLGLTTLDTAGDHITAAKVALNANREMTPGTRLAVTCHELGHVAGLTHRGGVQSCLGSGDRDRRTQPDRHDFFELEKIYAHSH